MKKFIIVILTVTLLCLAACTTLETYVENEGGYDVFPITNNFSDFNMGNYKLTHKKDSSYEGDNKTISTKEYLFYEGSAEICKVEVITIEEKGFMLDTYEGFIKFLYNTGMNVEYKMTKNMENYMTFQTGTGTVKFNYYKSRNKNDPGNSSETVTGLDVLVNNERQGILAFYPDSFYLKKGTALSNNMALYVLSTHVSRVNN